LFLKFKNNYHLNIYTIKYEDLFIDKFNNIKNILNNIGFIYTDKIFDNTAFINKIIDKDLKIYKAPANYQHTLYRTWQINQPFVMHNDISKIDLTDKQKKIITSNQDIINAYSEIKNEKYN
jgi:hypothetical protein